MKAHNQHEILVFFCETIPSVSSILTPEQENFTVSSKTTMKNSEYQKLKDLDFTDVESLDRNSIALIGNHIEPEFYSLLKVDYSVFGSVDFHPECDINFNSPRLRHSAFVRFIAISAKRSGLQRRCLPYAVTEERGLSGEHFHFHFLIASHIALKDKKEQVVANLEDTWEQGFDLPDTGRIWGRSSINVFDPELKREAVLYLCKKDYWNKDGKEITQCRKLRSMIKQAA